MSITQMRSADVLLTNPENVVVVRNYCGAEEGIRHAADCAFFVEEGADKDWQGALTSRENGPRALHTACTEKCRYIAPLYMETTHRGVVLSLGEYNGRDDSDFYATFWNEEKGAPEKYTYASTRGWTYPNHASVDATDDVKAKYRAWQDMVAVRAQEARDAKYAADAAAAAKAAAEAAQTRDEVADARKKLNSDVTVTKGTGKKKVTILGRLFWVGVSGTGKSARAGVRDDKGVVTWTTLDKVVFT
jgi:hypothetical protein